TPGGAAGGRLPGAALRRRLRLAGRHAALQPARRRRAHRPGPAAGARHRVAGVRPLGDARPDRGGDPAGAGRAVLSAARGRRPGPAGAIAGPARPPVPDRPSPRPGPRGFTRRRFRYALHAPGPLVPMSNWLIAIAVTLLLGGVATFYFHVIQRRRDETRAGITALSGVSWRSFIHMVLDALGRRGFTRLVDEDNAGDDRDFVLVRGEERWLLSCKHGSAFVLGRLAVNELARAIELKEAAGAFLVTQGRISDEVRPVASLQRIELLDGPALWPQLRDFLPAQQLAAIRDQAAGLSRRRIVLSWLAALLAGVATWLALPSPSRPAPRGPAPAMAP